MTNPVPSNLLYTKDHEWTLVEDDGVKVGITDHAQHQLGDVVYLELPEIGAKLTAHKTFGVVESVKAVSDLFSPVTGEVIAVNSDLVNSPETINHSPYEQAWMLKVKPQNKDELGQLMSAEQYMDYLAQEAK